MGVCKGCGATIDWIRTNDGRYMPVEPEPVFIVEGDGFGRYVTDEGEVITGRRALLSEQNILCEVAFIPHWKNCPEAGHFRRGVRESKAKHDAERKAKGDERVLAEGVKLWRNTSVAATGMQYGSARCVNGAKTLRTAQAGQSISA